MANLLDLRNKITSTRNTGQITKALKMVSAARQKKAQDFLGNSRYLRQGIREIIHTVSERINLAEYLKTHQEQLRFFRRPPYSKKVLIISVMSQRGLCGSLNTNLFYEILKTKEKFVDQVDFITVNRSAQRYLKNFKESIVAFFSDIKENPEIDDIYPIIGYVKANYSQYASVYIAYTNFIKSGVYEPRLMKLIPILTDKSQSSIQTLQYTIEPDPISLLETLSNLYIDMEIYEAILSAQASEHNARMIAMKKASDNVKTVVDQLTLIMNKERQAKITQQMAEISANI